ncbi:uncharacterized protein PHALS_03567 [Plasmopara halstedii]|uniref:Heterogeneous nuclear ribonucleoprotein Q acidic domain-containing protein n=1 Tax=Plasmopara halstedii TaxID=4781 RepID=A0A0P1AWT7_PLAHL|nr:uncharacterized protein PHALS_03567 [Plasmopara halstedii]CEG46893.1 hypothetical protein PHALS_03567 [Plasmopara halstedii]|eukprot:XP_024583262.1 hypothetical protein PHALS_03567 [Plasmopara halstedii]
MEPNGPAVKDTTDEVYDESDGVQQAVDATMSSNLVESEATVLEEVSTEQDIITTPEEGQDVSQGEASEVKNTEMEAEEKGDTEKMIADDHEEHEDVIMEPASLEPVAETQEIKTLGIKDEENNERTSTAPHAVEDAETMDTSEEIKQGSEGDHLSLKAAPDEVNVTSDAIGEATQTDVSAKEGDGTQDDLSMKAAPDRVLDELAKNADLTSPIVPELIHPDEAINDATSEIVKDNEASSSPKHDDKKCNLPPPTESENVVQPVDDKYDPAKLSPVATLVDSSTELTAAAQRQEYDPDHPSMTSSAEAEKSTTDTSLGATNEEQSTKTSAKRKSVDESRPSDQSNGDSSLKRPRHDGGSKHDSHEDNHKTDRARRESGDSSSSISSRHKHHEEDHKGLSAAAWDRLMDFQTSGEFQVTQVSRAAFASVGAMPEFAQIAIIARFVRTPMKEVRDKNGQLMRIYREYQKENPQIAALQPVDAFVSDYQNDPGFFRFGYAPPQPVTGVSNVPVPYQRDPPKEPAPFKGPLRQAHNATLKSEPERNHRKDIDEFGRAVHSDKSGASESNLSSRTPSQRSALEPRQASRSRQNLSPRSTQATPQAISSAKNEDPRRREQPLHQNNSGIGRDPRRRSTLTSQEPPHRGNQSDSSRNTGSNDLYGRLPGPVRAVVDSMRREGRLQESLNDNVITRLLHLPEHVALQAVENFSNVDLSQVENLQGFLVGIINRVNEKAIASEKQHRPQDPSPRGQLSMPRSNNYGPPSQGASVLGGPPHGGRLDAINGVNPGSYRAQAAPIAAGPGPALFERPYETPQDSRDPRRRQSVPQDAPEYGAVPIGMPSFHALPMSVQNHIHSLVANHTLASLEELGGKCYEVLGQLSEPLANQVLARFAGANLSTVRNKSGFLIGVVKRARQEYGFN